MNNTINPKLAIPISATGKTIEVIGLLLLLSFWFFTLMHYKQLPDIIPTHFNGSGEVDGYGNKWLIITLPIVGTVMYLGLTLAARYPHKMNYAVPITETNAEKQYKIVTGMFRIMKIALVLVFFILTYQTVQIASDLPDIFGKSFLFLVFALVFVPVFYFLIQSSKNA